MIVAYVGVILVALMLPDRLVHYELGSSDIVENKDNNQQFFMRFRKTFKLTDQNLNDFQIEASTFTGTEIGFNEKHT